MHEHLCYFINIYYYLLYKVAICLCVQSIGSFEELFTSSLISTCGNSMRILWILYLLDYFIFLYTLTDIPLIRRGPAEKREGRQYARG